MSEQSRPSGEPTDPQWLMDSLEKQIDALGNEAYERFVRVIPEARQYTPEQKSAFIDQAKGRFSAILSVMTQGIQVDRALRKDLEEVGASAAWAGTSLPHLLLVLRISRDLLIQSALRLADQRGRELTATLGAFSARMLPSIDRLTDALSDGFWSAKLDQQQEEWHRLASIVEGSPYGIYEADLDGNLQYANNALAIILDRPPRSLMGRSLTDLIRNKQGAPVGALLAQPDRGLGHHVVESTVGEKDTVLVIDTVLRKVDNDIVGFGGIVRRVDDAEDSLVAQSSPAPAAAVDTSSLVPEIEELRQALATLGEAGQFLDRHAERMTMDRTQQAGVSIVRQSKRMLSIVQQLDQARQKL